MKNKENPSTDKIHKAYWPPKDSKYAREEENIDEYHNEIWDEFIKFVGTKDNSMTITEMLDLSARLDKEFEEFDERNWVYMPGWKRSNSYYDQFEKIKTHTELGIKYYKSEVLEVLVTKLLKKLNETTKKEIQLLEEKIAESENADITELIKKEVAKQVKTALSKKTRKK